MAKWPQIMESNIAHTLIDGEHFIGCYAGNIEFSQFIRTYTRLGDRSFPVAGPRIWNSLHASLRQPDIEFGQFKRLLKTFLYNDTAAH